MLSPKASKSDSLSPFQLGIGGSEAVAHHVGTVGNNVRFPFRGKAVLLLQIAALVLIQMYASAPLPPPWTNGHPRHHEEASHHQCGCPKEKVASHTCCCALYKRSCCARSGHGTASASGPGQKDGDTVRIHATTCGLSEELDFDSSGRSKFMGASFAFGVPAPSVLLTETTQKQPSDHFLKPPVPPPEMTRPGFA